MANIATDPSSTVDDDSSAGEQLDTTWTCRFRDMSKKYSYLVASVVMCMWCACTWLLLQSYSYNIAAAMCYMTVLLVFQNTVGQNFISCTWLVYAP